MSRRKPLRARYPSGQIVPRSGIASPIAIKRLTDAAVAGLRDASWGTMLGRIYLAGKISAGEYSAGRRWAALVAEYAVACQGPRPPKTVLLDAVGGRPATRLAEDSAMGVLLQGVTSSSTTLAGSARRS